ncbi:hypothetical protein OBBRIDRAFT_892031 [Obba rivulosa]|uniref:MYND-type domain-containing protein n=1 Tax=Obba rivulosa TaxID=1052685 RepID=A0A8E2AKK7_9APHY|nr:hypothetical protein OBBRIDRAFT_892031 [Obba rivulosa]
MDAIVQGTGGLAVTDEMRAILSQPGFLKVKEGGKMLRTLYQKQSMAFDSFLLDKFAMACFFGASDKVKKNRRQYMRNLNQMIESKTAPSLNGRITPIPNDPNDHAATVKYLLEAGASPNVQDIVGHTALQHASMYDTPLNVVRCLLEHGANVNHQNRYGEVAIGFAAQSNRPEVAELLMEFGADVDIPDADGVSTSDILLGCGPQVMAAVRKWQRRRAGEAALFEEKKCDGCATTKANLMWCSRCKAARYCSVQCQREHWRTHKQDCRPINASNSVTVRPRYGVYLDSMSASDMIRQRVGIPIRATSKVRQAATHAPPLHPDEAKAMTVKVQIPYRPKEPLSSPVLWSGLLVYNKSRSFTCTVHRDNDFVSYDRIVEAVRTKGAGGAKAYFPAQLESGDKLIIKIGEVLAEQPF